MGLVVIDKGIRLRLCRTGQPKSHVDPLEDGRVASVADSLEVDFDPVEPNVSVPGSALHHERTAGRNAGEEGIGRRHFDPRAAEVRRLVDDELTVSNRV
jgi:hypothetical protein